MARVGSNERRGITCACTRRRVSSNIGVAPLVMRDVRRTDKKRSLWVARASIPSGLRHQRTLGHFPGGAGLRLLRRSGFIQDRGTGLEALSWSRTAARRWCCLFDRPGQVDERSGFDQGRLFPVRSARAALVGQSWLGRPRERFVGERAPSTNRLTARWSRRPTRVVIEGAAVTRHPRLSADRWADRHERYSLRLGA